MKGSYLKKEEFVTQFLKEWAQVIAFSIAGLLFSNATLFKTMSPFGIALIASLNSANLYAGVLGAVVGYCFGQSAGIVLKYIGALILCVVGKWLLSYKTSPSPKNWETPLVAFLSLFLSGGIILMLTHAGGYSYFSLFIESVIALVGSVLFNSAHQSLLNRRPICRLSVLSKVAVLFSLCVAVISFQGLRVYDFYIGNIISGYITLLLALNSGALTGAGVGVVLGVALGIYSPDFLNLGVVLSLGGLLSGAFKDLGKSRMALMFTISSVFLSLLSGDDSRLIPTSVEMLFSSLLFLVYSPENDYFKNISSPKEHPSNAKDIKRLFDRRVLMTAESLSEIGDITKRVALGLDKTVKSGEKAVFDKVIDQVCKKCTMHDYCFDGYEDKLKSAFKEFTPKLREDGAVSQSDCPEFFSSRCPKSRDIVKSVNQNYSQHIKLIEDTDKLSSVRQVICEQFDAMASMLKQLQEELKTTKSVNGDLTDQITASLLSMGITTDYVCAVERDFERITVEICINKIEGESVPDRHFVKVLNEITNRDYDYPCIKTIGDKIYYTFNEKACFDFDYFVLQTSLNPSDISGDSIGCFCDCDQFFNVVISDGMGAGRRAAVDSKMTVSLITKLIKSGFLYQNAINVVNSAMLVKSGEETMSSVDAMHLDLYTGKIELSKCGAAPTFIYRKNERVHTIENSALPIGILGGVKTNVSEMYLKAGDIVVMVTDGICDEEYIWLENLIMRYCDRTPKEICRFILKEVEENNPLPDDRTIMVGRVVTNG